MCQHCLDIRSGKIKLDLKQEAERVYEGLVRKHYQSPIGLRQQLEDCPLIIIETENGRGAVVVQSNGGEQTNDDHLRMAMAESAIEVQERCANSGIGSLLYITIIGKFTSKGQEYIAVEASNWKGEFAGNIYKVNDDYSLSPAVSTPDLQKDRRVDIAGQSFWSTFVKAELES